MQIPDDRIDDFIARWERAFGERLERGDARARAIQMLHLYRELLRTPQPELPGPYSAAVTSAESPPSDS